ncbi:spore germination protein [Bacillus sp. DTU_2020_1000418_1_SI_GHA_SEK_038]|uniref:spore germination protein n=1 Tax=Bacillus sp. DTU_2020_1000418_1_SI_GHA_SEK_038 TaxID=3077585 RepID=UPI0028EA62E4|nr:spore germination protein [Bacillus sp. DTU_2020_1000418_1_SI_GHA_SEK_038]WNS74877.1 spore germination protein [Bacillus sp. DTU_2020_1000418_1_SI_GHA_SEK_038]
MKKWISTKKSQQKQSNWEKELKKSHDFTQSYHTSQKTNIQFCITFMSTLVDDKIIQQSILPHLLEDDIHTIEDIKKLIPIADMEISSDPTQIEQKLFNGYLILTIGNNEEQFAFIAVQKEIVRGITPPEIEFSVIGPKEAFVESLGQNINLIRKRLPTKELIIEEYTLGKLSKTRIAILFMEGITDDENVNTVRQRIKDVEFDAITDSSYIVQLISDNSNSPFPQLLDTERPDRVVGILAEGKIAIIVDGSPHVLITPTTLVEFFGSFEDYFLNWLLASFFRLIRVFAVLFSILITPIYVAVLTYHYELIPQDLVGTLITSRRIVPFPPILEAIFLELTIELLREAGARLPTKVGQTIGIVGGIVIGTASVEAGLTSNVLLILVALAALGSFTTPVYKMGNTIRLLRFPFLLFAELWGLLGIVFCFSILLTHLIRLTSLGRPFLEPIYPLRVKDLKDTIVRLPFSKDTRRPYLLRTENSVRFNKEKANVKKDIDE